MPLTLVTFKKKDEVKFCNVKAVLEKESPTYACKRYGMLFRSWYCKRMYRVHACMWDHCTLQMHSRLLRSCMVCAKAGRVLSIQRPQDVFESTFV